MLGQDNHGKVKASQKVLDLLQEITLKAVEKFGFDYIDHELAQVKGLQQFSTERMRKVQEWVKEEFELKFQVEQPTFKEIDDLLPMLHQLNMQIKEQLPKDDLSISEEWLIRQDPDYKINDAFRCPICYFVVKEPVQCRGCQTIFCEDCIDEWVASNS